MKQYDVVIIGGGSAGLAAALEINKHSTSSILLLERGTELGGILLQCIHNGFGLKVFKEELTGPEYAERFINELIELLKIPSVSADTAYSQDVIDTANAKKVVVNPRYGIWDSATADVVPNDSAGSAVAPATK